MEQDKSDPDFAEVFFFLKPMRHFFDPFLHLNSTAKPRNDLLENHIFQGRNQTLDSYDQKLSIFQVQINCKWRNGETNSSLYVSVADSMFRPSMFRLTNCTV